MIDKDTIATIFETARIEEVVGDFVYLKKRGVNMLGLCPFHNEKTPSFTVSPAKGIYKCFGCGAGGNSVNFIMDHEHYTYPEALRYLAKKYNIAIEEKELTPEQLQDQTEKESQYIVSAFAEEFFIQQLHETDDGKNIGLTYFEERGFTEETIKKFRLGYSPESWDALTKAAFEKGYKTEYLEKTGLVKNKDGRVYDSYRGRVIFPIHNLSGIPIGFGGRALKKDDKTPKYVNTHECEIYHKSKVLYGMNFARKAIIEKDNCFLVEGYTDVISMHQSGIENVVSSSGTSLSTEQILLIRRFTKNVTILYDGDAAGIKASFRGIDMLLAEGMNVRVVLFPDGDDPDSFSKKVSDQELAYYIQKESRDFMVFKTQLLNKETEGDPIKKSNLVHEIIQSIALIPDHIVRDLYIKECSSLMDINEKALINELNKQLRRKYRDSSSGGDDVIEHELPVVKIKQDVPDVFEDSTYDAQEKDIIRIILNYGNQTVDTEVLNAQGELEKQPVTVAGFIVNELLYSDHFPLKNDLYNNILQEFARSLSQEEIISKEHFTNHISEPIRILSTELITERYELSNWEVKNIFVNTEDKQLLRATEETCYAYKIKRVDEIIRTVETEHKTMQTRNTEFEKILETIGQLNTYKEIKRLLSVKIGRQV